MTEVRHQETFSRRVSVGSVTLHVQEWVGEGTPLVLAHPTGFLGAIWRPIVSRLRAAGFGGRILTFDQRGHGLSSKPDTGYEWPRFVEDAIGLLRELGLHLAVGVGHSAGATTLAGVAAREPQRMRRLVMIDPILFDRDIGAVLRGAESAMAARTRTRRLVWSSREELFSSFRTREPYDTWTAEALRAYVDHGTFDRPDGEVELLCPGRIEAQVYQNSASMDVFDDLRALEIPVTLVRGERSLSFPADRAERALGCLRHGRLITVPKAGHFVPMEFPDRVVELILAELAA
jgi:pimeloyl-ACP methyl ester carboxylesterase